MSMLKTPWLSLTLVLLTQITLGRVIARANLPYYVWVLTAIAVVFLVKYLTSSLYKIAESTYKILGKFDLRFLGLVIFVAFLFFLMLAWFKVFTHTLLLIAAVILARIDFETKKLPENQAFLITSIFSLAGLALGAVVGIYVK